MLGTMRIQSFIKFLNCLLFNEKTGLKTSRKQQLIRAVKKKKRQCIERSQEENDLIEGQLVLAGMD